MNDAEREALVDAPECPRCNDTGLITVRVRYPMSYVCAGSPAEYARNVTEARCDRCSPIERRQEDEDDRH